MLSEVEHEKCLNNPKAWSDQSISVHSMSS